MQLAETVISPMADEERDELAGDIQNSLSGIFGDEAPIPKAIYTKRQVPKADKRAKAKRARAARKRNR